MDVIELTKELIKIKSVSTESNLKIANLLEDRLENLDFRVERIEYRDTKNVLKVSLVGVKGPDKKESGLVLLGHMDTVPAKDWKFDPFQPRVENDKIYGRGSCDMKGGLASILLASSRYESSELKYPLFVFLTSDEEIGCSGAETIAKHSKIFKELRPHYGVICEPTSMNVVNEHKGAVQFFNSASGKAAHSSTGKGFNANLKMIPFLSDMKDIYDQLTQNEEFFDYDFDPPFSDWNITFSDDDTPPNVTAPQSHSVVNYRPMPEHDIEKWIQKVEESGKRHDVDVEVRRIGPPLSTPVDSELVEFGLEVTNKNKPQTVPYGTDAMKLEEFMELILVGPGNIEQAHSVEEWVEISQLHQAVDVYSKFIERFCL